MPSYTTPGVKIEEIAAFPPSISPVATAIPAFFGATEKHETPEGEDLKNVPTRITSLLEYKQYFGTIAAPAFDLNVAENKATGIVVSFDAEPDPPASYLFYSMAFYFANGGGPCYVVSLGTSPPGTKTFYVNAFDVLKSYDEPTLLVFPDSTKLGPANHRDVIAAALQHCSDMGDRFVVADIRNATKEELMTNNMVASGKVDTIIDDDFRDTFVNDIALRKYGAVYFPYVRTSIPYVQSGPATPTRDDTLVTIKNHTGDNVSTDLGGSTLDAIKDDHSAIYNAILGFLSEAFVTLPPSGGVAGAYARVDRQRGVFKAPANVSLLNAIGTDVPVTDDLNGRLNVDPGPGKSINAIRDFAGKGTLIWGARTLAGNDLENRYVPVRRFLNMAEESIKKAVEFFVFEPNDANTWTKVRSMIEAFLTKQWRDGALAGAKPEDAFYVSVGLNQTMSAQDILDGYMIVEIGLAIVRPAEFIVLQFVQKMQES